MKKIIVTVMLFLSANMFLSANDTIKVDYHWHPEMEGMTPALMELYKEFVATKHFLGVDDLKITITGNITGKKFIIFTHIVKDGKDSLVGSDTSYFPMRTDTLKISVKSLPIDSNKVKIKRDYVRWSTENIYDIGSNKSCLLLGTSLISNENPNACGMDFYFTTVGEKFPIIAYSMGIPLENGEIHFCGLRDAGIHPKLWAEKFKIKNYVYFEMKFLD